jgi:hypothetical protein
MVEELTALCAEQHAFFPEDLVSAAECESTVMMGAERTGEPGLALAAAQRWQAAARGDPMAEGTLALLRGDPAAAASTLAPVVDAWPAEPDAPFFVWLQLGQAEITLGRAWRELGDARAAAMLALGLAHVERAAAGQKQPWVHHVLAHARFVAVSR